MSNYNGWLPGHATLGAIGATGPTGFHNGTGAVGANGAAGPYTISSNSNSTNSISFSNTGGEVLRITKDGEVQWSGRPSKAAELLEKTLGNMIDTKAASASMRQRTYVRACKSLLSKARGMTKEELVAYLEESISNRESKAVILALRDLAEMDE